MYKSLLESSLFVAAEESTAAQQVVKHRVLQQNIHPPFPAHQHYAVFAMGCFWGRNDASGSSQGCMSLP